MRLVSYPGSTIFRSGVHPVGKVACENPENLYETADENFLEILISKSEIHRKFAEFVNIALKKFQLCSTGND